MFSTINFFPIGILVVFTAGVLSAGCGDGPSAPEENGGFELPGPRTTPVGPPIECHVDAVALTMDCPPNTAAASVAGGPQAVILGGQGTYMQLNHDLPEVHEGVLSVTVWLQNRSAQPLTGYADRPGHLRVFFVEGPTNGVVVQQTDGTEAFTAPDQPYYEHIVQGEGNGGNPRDWHFALNGASSFTFKVYVAGEVPADYAALSWREAYEVLPAHYLNDIDGRSASDIYAVGSANVVLHFDGHEWSVLSEGDPWYGSNNRSVWVDPTGNPWVAGSVYDTEDRLSIWGTDSSNVYMIVRGFGDPYIRHFDGVTWSPISLGADYRGVYSQVWGTSANDVYIVGDFCEVESGMNVACHNLLRFDGTSWSTPETPDVPLHAIAGSGPSNVVAVGAEGDIVRYDGVAWTLEESGVSVPLHDVWVNHDQAFAVGDGGIVLHYDGTTWNEESVGRDIGLGGVWGSAPDDVYAIGGAGSIFHYDGTVWTQRVMGGEPREVSAVLVFETEAFAVGIGGAVLHRTDVVGWRQQNSGTTEWIRGVWGASPDAVWAVGDQGAVLRYDGVAWNTHDSGTSAGLEDVWGMADGTAWAVGAAGTILHYDGSGWLAQTSGTSMDLHSVWGSGASDVVAVGNAGTILRYDGSVWRPDSSGTSATLRDVWGLSASHILAVGGDGQALALAYDGSRWRPVLEDTGIGQLNALWGSPTTGYYAGGESGLMHWAGAEWTEHRLGEHWTRPFVPSGAIHGLHGSDGIVAAVSEAILSVDLSRPVRTVIWESTP